MDCCICGKPIEKPGWKHGNNAQPVKEGRCCDECDMTIVVPTRLKMVEPNMSDETALAIGRISHAPPPPELIEKLKPQTRKQTEE